MEFAHGEGAVFNVEIYADTICPWCYVGTRFLWEAMSNFPRASFQLKWRPYMIAPDIGQEGEQMKEFMQKRYGKAIDLDDPESALSRAADAAGISFDCDTDEYSEVKKKFLSRFMWNSAASHKLLEIAGKQDETHGPCEAGEYGLQTAVMEHLFEAHFKKGLNLSNPDILKDIAKDIGVTVEEDAFNKDALADIKQTSLKIKKEINGVPFFMISREGYPGSYRLAGTQPPQILMKAFDSLLIKREQLVKMLRLKAKVDKISTISNSSKNKSSSPRVSKKSQNLSSLCSPSTINESTKSIDVKRRKFHRSASNLLRFHLHSNNQYNSEIEAAAVALSGVKTKIQDSARLLRSLSHTFPAKSDTALPSPSSGDDTTSFDCERNDGETNETTTITGDVENIFSYICEDESISRGVIVQSTSCQSLQQAPSSGTEVSSSS